MAQIKRKKVSNAAVKGQKKENTLLKSKKFWIITSSIVVGLALIGFLVWLIVYLNTTKTNENPDYFAGESNIELKYENKDVKFTKSSYQGIMMHSNQEGNENDMYVDYIFVYAANLKTFYADNSINSGLTSDDENYISTDTIDMYSKLFNQLIKLQYTIDTYNAKSTGHKAQLYIVDTSVADNQSLLASKDFGGSDDSGFTTMFCLLTEDGLKKYYDKDNEEKTSLYGTNTNTIINTCMNSAINLITAGFEFND